MTPRISFIVPVKNDAARLETCLKSVLRNVGASSHHEIIVVDNGSTDGSGEVARRFGATVLPLSGGMRVSALRNCAAREAKGDILAFVDADNEIVSGWTRAAIETLRLPGVGAAGAPYLAPLDGTWVQRAYGCLRGRAEGLQDAGWLGSGNLAVWRRAFDSVGGFDTTLDACEDVDFCQRLRARGLRVVSDARLKSIHHGDPETLSDLFAGERWRGRDNLKVSLRPPVSLSVLPSAIVPVVDLLMVPVLAVALLASLTSSWRAMAFALAAVALVAAGVVARVARVAARDRAVRGGAILQLLVVVCVYDVARALALVSPAGHRRSQSPAVSATS